MRSDEDIYHAAFEHLLAEIEGDIELIRIHAEVLIRFATTGDKQGSFEMTRLIPENCWRWGALEDQVGITRYRERCAWFLRRLASYCFSMSKKEWMIHSVAVGANIRAKFITGNPEHTPEECNRRHGAIMEVSDPVISQTGPCERLNCSCIWTPTASGFEGAMFKSMVGKADGTPYTNAELRARAAARHPRPTR